MKGGVAIYLATSDVARSIEFYEKIGAEKVAVIERPDGGIFHGEMRFNGLYLLLGNQDGTKTPMWIESFKVGHIGAGVELFASVDDIDEQHDLISQQAKIIAPIEDKSFGARVFTFEDPDRYQLTLLQWSEEMDPVSPAEDIEKSRAEN